MIRQISWMFLLKPSLVNHYRSLIGDLQIPRLTFHLTNNLIQTSENYLLWLPELLERQLVLQFTCWHFLHNHEG